MDKNTLILALSFFWIKASIPQATISYNKANLPRCPEGFFESELNLCYIIINDTTYPPKCPFKDVVPFTQYKDGIKVEGRVWVPVERDLSNGLGLLHWVEPSSNYKDDFKESYLIKGSIKGKNCVYYNGRNYALSFCNEKISAICAYKMLEESTDQLCSEDYCFQSDFTAHSSCFCLGNINDEKKKKAEFLKPYQNYVYNRITSDDCTIGLEKTSDNTYMWIHSNQQINYTYWAEDGVSGHRYGAATLQGWISTERPIDECILYEKERDKLEPRLDLRFDNVSNNFILHVSDYRGLKQNDDLDQSNKLYRSPLLYCFTDASRLALKYRYPSLVENQNNANLERLEYSFAPYNNLPGNYWCESLKYLDLEVISSNIVFLRQAYIYPYEFIAILQVSYVYGTNPLDLEFFNVLERSFNLIFEINHLDKVYTVRIMKFLEVNEETNKVIVNMHFTSEIQENFTDEEIEYKKVKELIDQVILDLGKQREIEIKDFLSADFCAEERTGHLIWPKTPNSTIAISNELCIKPDGTILTRFCDGNFIDGARWSSVTEENCNFFQKSSVTEELMSLIISQGLGKVGSIEELERISRRYDDFKVLDVYLISKIFTNLAEDYYPTNFSQVISNLLEVDKSILLDSQIQLNATDRILANIDKIFSSNTNIGLEGIRTDNFYILARPPNKIPRGLTVQRNASNSHEINIVDNYCSIEAIKDLPGIESAICLDPKLEQEVIVTVFLKDSFFNQNSSITISPVFGFHLPNYSGVFPGSLYIFHKSEYQIKSDCSFWESSENSKGFWMKDSESEFSFSFSSCKFTHGTHFALTTAPYVPENVTDSLLDTLDSDCSPAEKIDQLRNISERYYEFTEYDVYLVGQILKNVSEDQNIDLEALAEIVSNMHFIHKDILSNSQRKDQATDMILYYTDEILKIHEYTGQVEATKDNFFLLVTDLKSNFSGWLLLDANQTQILNEDIEINDLLKKFDNLESAVVFSRDLKEQLEDVTKVVITVFVNDALFNEKEKKSKNITKIFGVLLPEIDNYNGPLSVVHKVDKGYYHEDCVHWKYNTTAGLTGLWFKDQEGENLTEFVHCKFWHTTHFALLLLDHSKYKDDQLLEWITSISCGLSLFGLFSIIFTAVVFKRWRSNTGNQILLNFVFVMISQISLFYVSSAINHSSDDYLICTIVGIVLHYSIISAFCWMLVIAILQFKRFVEVLGGPPKGILFKACLCGWIVPLIPVALVYILDTKNYTSGNVGLCYPSGLGLYLGVWLPIAIIVVINCFIFTMIMYSVGHRKSECRDVSTSDILFQWRLAFLLFFMLGLTWTFGFLGELDFGETFVLLFCITGSLQGFVMFLFFIVFNVNTRYLYKQALKRCCCRDYY